LQFSGIPAPYYIKKGPNLHSAAFGLDSRGIPPGKLRNEDLTASCCPRGAFYMKIGPKMELSASHFRQPG
jgi:hypothetical protein